MSNVENVASLEDIYKQAQKDNLQLLKQVCIAVGILLVAYIAFQVYAQSRALKAQDDCLQCLTVANAESVKAVKSVQAVELKQTESLQQQAVTMEKLLKCQERIDKTNTEELATLQENKNLHKEILSANQEAVSRFKVFEGFSAKMSDEHGVQTKLLQEGCEGIKLSSEGIRCLLNQFKDSPAPACAPTPPAAGPMK